jgi:hypothetical protein
MRRQPLENNRGPDALNVYQRVFQIVWGRLAPTFGIKTINAIAKNSIVRQSKAYPLLALLTVDDDGLVWGRFETEVRGLSNEEAFDSLDALLDEFFDAVSNLIGKLIVGKIFQEAEEAAKKGDEL